MGASQLAEVLRLLPKSAHPDLLVGFDTSDDAGVFRVSEDKALVQTMDFFTPIVDDPYAYGQIAAANALSDVYAMGGVPLTVMNIACFNPTTAGPEVWAEIFKGMSDKCEEAGAAVVGGHTVEDEQPKFGLSVTGVVNPEKMFHNANAKPGDKIYLTKPLGTGIITTAAKYDDCKPEVLQQAVDAMAMLNAKASERAQQVGCTCATDITGFGLAGHLFNIARASNITIEIRANNLPLFADLQEMIERKNIPAGAFKNRDYLKPYVMFCADLPEWMQIVLFDPQTSGGLAIFTQQEMNDYPLIGEVFEGGAKLRIL